MKKIIIASALALSCIATAYADKNVRFDFQTSEARGIDVYPTTYIQPLVAEVKVNTQAGRFIDTWKLSPSEFMARQYPDNDAATLQNLRAYGLFKSSEHHNCDVIVAATFDIKISNEGAVVVVKGYPANFANWGTAKNADYEWIKIERGNETIDDKNEK